MLSVDKISYFAQQRLLYTPLDKIQSIARLFLPVEKKVKIPKNEINLLNKRFEILLDADIKNVENGLYPKDLLFDIPFNFYIKNLPGLFFEALKMYDNLRNNIYNKLPENINTEEYPSYFTRNFHWQSDGYFSLNSAKLYDIGVEMLFLGTADIMRRQVIPHITRFLRDKNVSNIKMLDIACGTSRTIKQINRTHPDLKITGLDLSPYYVEFSKNEFKNNS